MIAERPNIDPQGRYTAMQAARILGVSRMTIHRWKAQGLLTPRLPKNGGRARYSGRELLGIWADEY